MADSNNPRSHRGYDPQQRVGAADDGQPSSGGDPLAELARLIGQNDPFGEFERNRARGEAPRRADAPQAAAPPPLPPQPEWTPQPVPAMPARMPPPPPQQIPDPAAAGHAEYAEYAGQSGYAAAGYADQSPDTYQDGYDPYADPEGHALDEVEYQEQQERRRRRRRLAMVIAILMLAVVGGAGAYGYRTFIGSAIRSAVPPPVIKADTTPAKVIPATQTGDSASNKLIYDRVGDGKQSEKILPREEKPVDIKTATVAQPPRTVYPAPDANVVAAPPPSTIPVTAERASGQVLPVTSEPSIVTHGGGAILPSAKKVRTLTIRPDMTVVPTAGNGSGGIPEPAARATTPVRAAEAATPTRSVETAPAARAETPPPSIAPARSVAPPPRQAAGAPLSLSPGGAPSARPAAPAAPQALAANPPAAAAEPRAAAAGGSFLVQVASQRSEGDANASFRALQTRYPNVLSGRSSVVRRADLGSKGIYYRAMVGPFATGEQAVQFCSSLKAAGGQCIIHRN